MTLSYKNWIYNIQLKIIDTYKTYTFSTPYNTIESTDNIRWITTFKAKEWYLWELIKLLKILNISYYIES